MAESPSNSWWDRILGVAMIATALCTIVVTSVVLWHASHPPRGRSDVASEPPTPLPKDLRLAVYSGGRRLGPANASVTVVEFGDYECPYCARFHRLIGALQALHPGELALIFRHWPLSFHRFALPAARASECAAAQGRFAAMHQRLFAGQDSLGLVSFVEFAMRAGVTDSSAFKRCMAVSQVGLAIEEDTRLAAVLRAKGTPAVVVDSMLYSNPPDSSELERLLSSRRRRGR